MTIYANEAKQNNGQYDPIHTLAEIGATETLNGEMVRLTLNTGFTNGDELNYDFIYNGSVEGTHFTLSELKNLKDYELTLPPNKGSFIKIDEIKFNEALSDCVISNKYVGYCSNKKVDEKKDVYIYSENNKDNYYKFNHNFPILWGVYSPQLKYCFC